MTQHPKIKLAVLGLAVILILGFGDFDAEFMAQRFSDFWRSVDYWELNPFIKLNWWLSYIISVSRLAIGAFLLGWLSHDYLEAMKK
jgi:hypothetical protein